MERYIEPTAVVCVSGYDTFPWEGAALGLALWKARISLVLTMACGVRHLRLPCRVRFEVPLHCSDALRSNTCHHHIY